MQPDPSMLPVLIVLLPLVGGVLAPILGRGIFRSSSNMLTLYYRMMGAKIGRRCQIAKTGRPLASQTG